MNTHHHSFSRRDFLKLAATMPLAYAVRPLVEQLKGQADTNKFGVIVLVFDALTAKNLSLYRYPLHTMPNLEKFAENATVYHRHYSAATFTIPGTASLLSGLYPWSHRALTLGAGGVAREHIEHQIFALFNDTYNSAGYSQNKYSDSFLSQFGAFLDKHFPSNSFDHEKRVLYDLPFFKRDRQVAFSAFDDNIFHSVEGTDSSLFLGPLYRLLGLVLRRENNQKFKKQYPDGLPDSTDQFLLSDLVDGAIDALKEMQAPSLSYFHFHPPHHPYRPTEKYANSLYSIFAPLEKPVHPLASEERSYVNMRRNRQAYDEYLLSWDEEAGRLLDFLRSSGLLEKNYVIITSDHGEMFERGEIGHFTPLMYEPLIHIPLIISQPGQIGRKDVHAPTSSTDILPSLGQQLLGSVPAWAEGVPLPELGGVEDPERSIYTIDAKQNPAFAPLHKFSIALTKGQSRLIHYNYPDYETFEFYDIENDPEELNDLYPSQPALAKQMQDELLQKLDEVNKPYRS
ncbi:MAG: sulfatase-like hydrolase/transferase [Anaerolineales bacterium]